MKGHVFVCYSHSDLSVAKTLVRQLESYGFLCWAAFRDLVPGQPPLQSLHQALQQSHAAVLIQSPAAESSAEILRQLEWLVVNDRPLFALISDKFSGAGPLDDSLKRSTRFEIPLKPTVAFWNQLADSLLEQQIPYGEKSVGSGLTAENLRKFGSPVAGVSLAAVLLVALAGWFFWGKSDEANNSEVTSLSKIFEQTRDLQRVLNRESTIRVTPPPTDLSPRLQNSLGMKFVLIPSGSFTRRSSLNPTENYTISLSRAYYFGVTEVTQKQFEGVMGINPSIYKGDLLPVDCLSWYQAVEFCERLNALPAEVRAGRFYRLPTEAEWEFAARAGSGRRYFFGESLAGLGEFAWYAGNSNGRPSDVGVKLPNPWGLYDVLGNVREWCSDWLAEYPANGLIDPTGPASGENKVARGGDYSGEDYRLDANWRFYGDPNKGRAGIRVVCELRTGESPTESKKVEK